MVHLVMKYLEINNYGFKNKDFEDSYLSHPNYPSLYAVTDTFNLLQIENVAARIPKEQFVELPDYFLSMLDGEFALVNKNETSVEIKTINGNSLKLSFDDFLNRWNQLIIAIEPNLISKSKLKFISSKWYLYILPCIALTSLSLFFNTYSLKELLLLSTSLLGLIVSVFIVQEKFGIKNEVASKLCSLNTNSSCESVIQSKKSAINKWISFSDLPLLFFSISVVTILIQPKNSGVLVGLLSVFTIPIVLYSIWLQKFELKKWCVLCLVVSLIIVTQSLVFGITTTSFIKTLRSVDIFEFLFTTILFTSLWLLVEPTLNKKVKTEKETNELKRFKRDYNLFKVLSKNIPVIDGLNRLKGIQIGSQNATVQLTIIISPSCGHCHTAFQEAYELIKNFPERVSLNVLFNINPENFDNPYKIVVESLLTINHLLPEKVEEAIIDWHIKKMELEEWKKKWIVEHVDMMVNHQVHEQYNWCLKNEFNYTPVKIVNDKMFPNEYEISELKYFLNDFSEENEEKYILKKSIK